MEQEPIRNDARKARRRRKLGRSGPCLFCGRETPKSFRIVGYSIVEDHHVVGKANDRELRVFLCRGCHDVQTELMEDHGIELRQLAARPWPEILIDTLTALGLFHQQVGTHLLSWAEQQRAFVERLDECCPTWRELTKQ